MQSSAVGANGGFLYLQKLEEKREAHTTRDGEVEDAALSPSITAEAAILVKEIDEVFEARIASDLVTLASSEKMVCLTDSDSLTA